MTGFILCVVQLGQLAQKPLKVESNCDLNKQSTKQVNFKWPIANYFSPVVKVHKTHNLPISCFRDKHFFL